MNDCDCDICAERTDFCDCTVPGEPCPYHNPDPDAEPELDPERV